MSDRISHKAGCLLNLRYLETSFADGLPWFYDGIRPVFRKVFEKLW